MSDTPARIGDIAAVARDDVHVEVLDGLARNLSRVQADVVAVRVVAVVEQALHLVDKVDEGDALLPRCVEPRHNKAACDHQRVTWADRIGVEDCEGEGVAREPLDFRQIEEDRTGRHQQPSLADDLSL